MCDCWFAIFLVHSHFFAVFGISSDRTCHSAGILCKIADDDPTVSAVAGMVFDLLRDVYMRRICFTDNKRAGRILIDPVYDSGADNAVDPAELIPTVVHDGIHQRSAVMSGRRMDNHVLWLIDN